MALPIDKIPILEKFINIQGEGRNLGVPYGFIRVGGCPLRCRFCDSEYTWKMDPTSITDIKKVCEWAIDECKRHNIEWVSVTGGEPMLYPKQLIEMMLYWREFKTGFKVHIETSGRFYDAKVHAMCEMWSMDMKTPCTREDNKKDMQYLKYMRAQDQVKCLIEDEADLAYAAEVRHQLDPKVPLVLQPFNIDVDQESPEKSMLLMQQYKWICDKIFKDGGYWPNIIITPQVHVLVWGNAPCV